VRDRGDRLVLQPVCFLRFPSRFHFGLKQPRSLFFRSLAFGNFVPQVFISFGEISHPFLDSPLELAQGYLSWGVH
jgi:hypothetical protein